MSHARGAELWKTCAVSGSLVESIARMLEELAVAGEQIDWWERGVTRGGR